MIQQHTMILAETTELASELLATLVAMGWVPNDWRGPRELTFTLEDTTRRRLRIRTAHMQRTPPEERVPARESIDTWCTSYNDC